MLADWDQHLAVLSLITIGALAAVLARGRDYIFRHAGLVRLLVGASTEVLTRDRGALIKIDLAF